MTTIGLVGCGKQAGKHASALSALGADLVVADRDASLATQLANEHGAIALADPSEIFAHPGIAGIDICTPTPSHMPLCLSSIEAGLPFFVEKPLCETAAQARAVNDAAQRAGVVGTVGYIYRFAPSIEAARSIVQAGGLGDIISASFRIGGRGNHQVWKHRRSLGGGAVSEMLVHMLDLAIWIFGQVERIDLVRDEQIMPTRSFRGVDEAVDAEDFVVALAQCASGPEVLIQADFVSGVFRQSIEIHGTNGTVVAAIDPSITTFSHLHVPMCGHESGRKELPSTGDLYSSQLGEFMEVVNGERTTVRSSVADSVLLMEALELVQKGRTHA